MFGYYWFWRATQRIRSLWRDGMLLGQTASRHVLVHVQRLLTEIASSATTTINSQTDASSLDVEDIEQPSEERQLQLTHRHSSHQQSQSSNKHHSLVITAHQSPLQMIFPFQTTEQSPIHSCYYEEICDRSSSSGEKEEELCLGLFLSSDTLGFWIRQLQLCPGAGRPCSKRPIRTLILWDNQTTDNRQPHPSTIPQQQQARQLWRLLLDQGLRELQVHGFHPSPAGPQKMRESSDIPKLKLCDSWLHHILLENDFLESTIHSSSSAPPSESSLSSGGGLKVVRLYYLDLRDDNRNSTRQVSANSSSKRFNTTDFLGRIVKANPRIHSLYMAHCTLAAVVSPSFHNNDNQDHEVQNKNHSWSRALQYMPQLQSLTMIHCGVTDIMLDQALSSLASPDRKQQLLQQQREQHRRAYHRAFRSQQSYHPFYPSTRPLYQDRHVVQRHRHSTISPSPLDSFAARPITSSRSVQFLHERGMPSLLDTDEDTDYDDAYARNTDHPLTKFSEEEDDDNDLLPLNLELHGNFITASSISLLAHTLRQEESLLQSVTLHANPCMDTVLLHQQERRHAQRRSSSSSTYSSSSSADEVRSSPPPPCPALYHFLEVLQTHHTSLRHFSWHNCTGTCCEACELVAQELAMERQRVVWNKWMQVLLLSSKEEDKDAANTSMTLNQKNPLWSHWLRPLARQEDPSALYAVLCEPRVRQALLIQNNSVDHHPPIIPTSRLLSSQQEKEQPAASMNLLEKKSL